MAQNHFCPQIFHPPPPPPLPHPPWLDLRNPRKTVILCFSSRAITCFFKVKFFLQGLNCLRKSQQLCDFTLISQNVSFPVHKSVMAACSDYFNAMLTGDKYKSFSKVIFPIKDVFKIRLHYFRKHLHDRESEQPSSVARFVVNRCECCR